MHSDNPTAAILLIGDELLSGRTQDLNAHHLAGVLAALGIDLREIRVVADDLDAIVAAIRALDGSLGGAWQMLFTSGGIGPTHDDITADAVAAAFDTGIEVHEGARAVMAAHYDARGLPLTESRLRMARIPVGATLIDNAVSAAPGFSIGNTHVMAGVPSVFRAMVQALVPRLTAGRPVSAATVTVLRPESDLADALRSIAADWPDLSIGSYPFRDERGFGANLVIRGLDPARVAAAEAALQDAFRA